MTIHTTDFQRQVELEIDMSNLGAARFASRMTKEIEQDRGGETKAVVSLFKFKDHDVRVATIAGEPWYVASDVCRVLVLSNPAVSVRALQDDEWSKANLGQRGMGDALIISESGLYKLVMCSDKPEAKDFQNWLAKAVLPAIRKDGGHIHGEEHVVSGAMSEDELVLEKKLSTAI